ncbi:hypothetical protein BU26DRAFT_21813 [Trematosphaeria pertusa]|uniref:Uncharacterized protein n=1 Tax=Trematosphaeria pertusa TaxID=390896 RepID=A0A6A6J4M2_9PLEO|nr:uncharacterized protein BU26DRAFT_21813 [Trematosphaeria pertusa]KAF2256433.1 hypothetical protein BU26DRAFT_21813 [Trematosphaeria pertusa]
MGPLPQASLHFHAAVPWLCSPLRAATLWLSYSIGCAVMLHASRRARWHWRARPSSPHLGRADTNRHGPAAGAILANDASKQKATVPRSRKASCGIYARRGSFGDRRSCSLWRRLRLLMNGIQNTIASYPHTVASIVDAESLTPTAPSLVCARRPALPGVPSLAASSTVSSIPEIGSFRLHSDHLLGIRPSNHTTAHHTVHTSDPPIHYVIDSKLDAVHLIPVRRLDRNPAQASDHVGVI